MASIYFIYLKLLLDTSRHGQASSQSYILDPEPFFARTLYKSKTSVVLLHL